ERKNRHILGVTRSLLIDGNVPSHLWGEAVSSAVYLINRTPSSVLNFRRPFDVLSDHCILPPIVYLPPHIFGCVIYVHLHPHQRTKLEERAIKCVFVGEAMKVKCIIMMLVCLIVKINYCVRIILQEVSQS
ncbi:hypothetical protein VIGAN_10045600, partial [Vigna angularis var. angularis]